MYIYVCIYMYVFIYMYTCIYRGYPPSHQPIEGEEPGRRRYREVLLPERSSKKHVHKVTVSMRFVLPVERQTRHTPVEQDGGGERELTMAS